MEIKPQSKATLKVSKARFEDSASRASSKFKYDQKEIKQLEKKDSLQAFHKEYTKPLDIKLHTQQRAAKRAIFNHFVATKLYFIERQKKQEEKLRKMLEEEKIKLMRKEMVPKAQLMPFFDKPFFPQRSGMPLTIPREPNFHMLSNRSWSCLSRNELYFQHSHAMKAI
ncbi:microtubule-destabilizing protein 60 [Silene latifolia]|uniref:microtubule-destabilizing protein 60 n=1 Tax=Silene latifolia TaxID=37657 RepID=UPI003D78B2CC